MRVSRLFASLGNPEVVQAPGIHPFSKWVADRSALIDLLRGIPAPMTPDPLQLLGLWERAIRESWPDAAPQIHRKVARQARDAERLHRQWDPGVAAALSGGPGRFSGWAKAVEAEKAELGWHNAEDWMNRLSGQLRHGDVPEGVLPKSIRVAGFAELTRLERRVLDALGDHGVSVTIEAAPNAKCRSRRRLRFGNPEEELSAAARWAGEQVANGRHRIAVIVNGLERRAGMVRTIFENELHAGAVIRLDRPDRSLFSMSAAESLAAHPLVSDALMLLDLAARGTDVSHEFPLISRWLLSANWEGGARERQARASLELSLRRSGCYRWSLKRVAQWAASGSRNKELRRLVERVHSLDGPGPKGHPAHVLTDRLRAWGWPGNGAEAGAPARVVERLLHLLERLSRQEFEGVNDCLDALRSACELETMPAPGGAFSPIQVMPPEQAFGVEFDSAWVANLTMENWPGRPVVNPLLDSTAARLIPRATEEGVLDYSRRLTDALRNCAEEVLFSWCDRLDDMTVSASPLIEDLPVLPQDTNSRSTLWRAIAPEASRVTSYRDHPWLSAHDPGAGLPLDVKDSPKLPGAVTFLEYQSACPLAAYFAFRLGARMHSVPTPFSDAGYRGELVHSALERLYRPEREGDGRVPRSSITSAVQAVLDSAGARNRLLPVERAALRSHMLRLLEDWLAFEQPWRWGRTLACEWRADLRFEGFEIDVRIDRLDQSGDGRVTLLDYKTGATARLPGWSEQRLRDVQLPLYAVLLKSSGVFEPAGVAIASIRPGQLKYTGISGDERCEAPGIAAPGRPEGRLGRELGDWEAALDRWRTSLAALLAEIRGGDCRFELFEEAPLNYAGLDVLLRMQEARRWRDEVKADG